MAPGEIGEITVRSDHVMQGDRRMPEETAKALRDGWLWTGDLAMRDDSGLITLAGRSKEMPISGGHNIYPQEVEAVLTSCSGRARGCGDRRSTIRTGRDRAVAFVSIADDATLQPDEIIAAVKPRLGIKTPKRLTILTALPKTPNGKVDKKVLREQIAAGARP